MQPTTLFADPALRFAGVRLPTLELRPVARASTRRPIPVSRILMAVALALVAGGLGYLRTWPPLATVMSASMAPTINTGDMVLLKKLDRPAQLRDVVAIRVPDDARSRYGYPPVVIHRIVKIAPDGTLTTQGDARKEPDPFTVPRQAVSTRVVATVPAAGRLVSFLGSPLGLIWLVSGTALFVALPLLDRYRDSQHRGQDERQGLQVSLEAVTVELAALRVQRDEAAEAKAQLHLVTAAFEAHLEQLPAQIERAIAAAVAAMPLAPPPPPPPPPAPRLVGASQWKPPTPPPPPAPRLVAASQWKPPTTTPDLFGARPAPAASTPDLMGVLALQAPRFVRPPHAAAWDSPPVALAAGT